MGVRVVCVLRTGGEYTRRDVQRLHRMVAENISRDYEFVCLTDSDERMGSEIRTEPIHHLWPRWWPKVELFRLEVDYPTLYLDLDTVVVGQIDDMFHRGRGLRMTRDFVSPERMNSSVMSWSTDLSRIYDRFGTDPVRFMNRYRRFENGSLGDQAFIEDTARPAGLLVEPFLHPEVCSFKLHAGALPPEGSSVVCFHGRPKPLEAAVRTHWVRERIYD